jgi:hypothetical protein
MIAATRRLGGETLTGLILIAALVAVFLTAPSGDEPELTAASDIPEHALHCAVCRLPRFGQAGSPSQFGPGSEGAEATSTRWQTNPR